MDKSQPVTHPPRPLERPRSVVVWSATIKLPIGNTCHSSELWGTVGDLVTAALDLQIVGAKMRYS